MKKTVKIITLLCAVIMGVLAFSGCQSLFSNWQQALINAKQEKIQQIIVCDQNDYYQEEWDELSAICNEAKNAVNALETIDQVNAFDLEEYNERIKSVKTIAQITAEKQAFELLKSNAILQIDEYAEQNGLNDFSAFKAAETAFSTELYDIKANINAATDENALQKAVDDGKNRIENLVVSATFTFADEGWFLKTKQGELIADMSLNIPYFDLKEFGYEAFYRYQTDSFENGGAYIGDQVIKQPTVLHAFIYMHYLYSPNGLADFSVSGAATSLYMTSFWGMDENLNYYVNYKYPVMAPGWGCTCDYILLEDGLDVELAHWSDWMFWMSGAQFIYPTQKQYSVNVGECVTFYVEYDNSGFMGMGDGGTQKIDVQNVYALVFSDSIKDLEFAEDMLSDVDANGNYTFTPTKSGTYYIVFCSSQAGGAVTDYFVVPCAVKVIVK